MVKKIMLLLFLLSLCSSSLAASFFIEPVGKLPTSVPKGETVSASFLVKNATNNSLKNNFVKTLPANTSQVICDANFCDKQFTLSPNGTSGDSCILKLSIHGAISSADPDLLSICEANGIACDTGPKIAVALAPSSPLMGVASGNYSNVNLINFPLVALSNDNGSNWSYPPEVYQNLDITIGSQFFGGFLPSSSCTGVGDKAYCIAAGNFCADFNCNVQYPLVATGQKRGTKWFYPKEVYENLTKQIAPDFLLGFFSASSCVGTGNDSTCIATGGYCTDVDCFHRFPLLAVGKHKAEIWSYPPAIFQNLKATIHPNFANGSFLNASCAGSNCSNICIATGSFCTDTFCSEEFPLVALSVDSGKSWQYPKSIFTDLNITIDANFTSGFLNSASCTGKGTKKICIASGQFSDSKTTLPLLAVTRDSGATWNYPHVIFQGLKQKISADLNGAFFNAASCKGSGKNALCISVGAYFTTDSTFPLLAMSQNSGKSWAYPKDIFENLTIKVTPTFARGVLNSAGCGSNGLCIAAGGFCNDIFCNTGAPLIAVSQDGGTTWTYPSSVFENMTAIDEDFQLGFFTGAACTKNAEHNLCIAAGLFNTSLGGFPLLAVSTDNGQTWRYPPEIFKNLRRTIDLKFLSGSFVGAASTGANFATLKFNKLTTREKLLKYMRVDRDHRIARQAN